VFKYGILYIERTKEGYEMKMNGNGNEMKENEKEVREMRIEFTDYEKEHRLNVIDLGDEGEFYGEYVVPELRRVYGYWYATEKAIDQLREDGWEIEDDFEPIWASVDYYIVNERTEQREKDLLNDENVWAFHFLELDWDNKEVYVESQEDAE